MTQMIYQTHTDIQVWNVRCEVQPASAFSARHGDIDTLFSFISRSWRRRTWMPRLSCIEGFFSSAVVRHLAPCGSWGLKCCDVWVVIMSCFFVQCAQVYLQFMWLDSTCCSFVVALFLRSCSRGHQSVFVIATSCVEWPGCTPQIQTRFHLQVRFMCFIRFRGTFFPFAHCTCLFN